MDKESVYKWIEGKLKEKEQTPIRTKEGIVVRGEEKDIVIKVVKKRT